MIDVPEKWIIVDKDSHVVRYVIHAGDNFIDEFIKNNYFGVFLCFRENEKVRVGPGWLCIVEYGGAHKYVLPPRNTSRTDTERSVSSSSNIPKAGSPEIAKNIMKIEAVIICKDYGDFLAHTLPENLQHLDDVVVVTHPDDIETQNVCRENSVECIKTTVFHEDGHAFNKGRGINLGLNHLSQDGWLLHLDADVVLPHRFRNMLHKTKLNAKNIYGCDRINILGYEKWMKVKNEIVPHYDGKWFVEPPKNHPLGARIIHMQYGWAPIGYFQLWHSSAAKIYHYKQGNAEHSDLLFSVLWPRENRILLPEVFVYHLESDDRQIMGINWAGRKTPRFGPK